MTGLRLAATYLLLALAGTALDHRLGIALMHAPVTGFAVAAGWTHGWRALPALLAGMGLFRFTAGLGAPAAGAAWLGDVLELVVAIAIARRVGLAPGLERQRDVLGAVLGSALLAPIGAGIAALATEGLQAGVHVWAVDGVGIVAVAPLLLAWTAGPLAPPVSFSGPIALLAHAAVVGLVFSGLPGQWFGHPSVAYLALPLLVWVALHGSLRQVTAAIAVLALAGTAALAADTGPFAAAGALVRELLLFLYLCVGTVTGLLVRAAAEAQRRAEQRAREERDRFSALTTLSVDWYWEQDPAGCITRIAGRAVDDGRVEAAAVIGRRPLDLALEFLPGERERYEEAMTRREPFRDVVFRDRNRDGAAREVGVSGEPVFAADGAFTGYRGVSRDITLERRAEHDARTSLRFLHALIEAIPSPVLVKDARHRYIAVNRAFRRFFRREEEQILGRTDHDFFDAEDARFYVETDDRALAGDADVHYEHAYRIDGDTLWMSVQKTALDAPDGSRVVLLLMIDVTGRREADEKLKASEQRFRSLTELSADWYWEQDEQLRFTYISPTASGRVIAETAEILGKTRFDGMFDWESEAALEQHRADTAARRPFRDVIVRGRRTGRWGAASGEPVFDADGRFRGYRGVGRDITELKRVEQQLRASEARFRDFAEAASEFVWETDEQDRYTFLSPKVRNVLDYGDAELLGRRAAEYMPPGEAERVAAWLAENARPDGSYRDLEHMLTTRLGATVWITVNAVAMHDAEGRIVGRRGTARDITDRKQAEERISHLATRDPLTGLPNRLLLHDRLEQALVNARRSRASVALMFLDLDRFKNINDSLGHHVGDLLLKEVAARMQGCLRKGDTLSRLGGDEFVVTVEGLEHAEDAAQVARKIINALAKPMDIAGHTLTTSCSIGISLFPEDAEDSATLMKNADTAMYHAKEKGRRNYQFFSREMNIRAVERHDLETALRLALDRDEFVLHYQPQIELATGRIVGVEALVRWNHPRKGLMLPSTFIDVAEETGLIESIGMWVLRAACEQNKRWQDDGLPPLRMAVNISARQFGQPKEFARALHRVLSTTGLDPAWLELEMTESVLWKTADESIQVLRRLGKLGTRIAVDDFGTGYSSLAYLKQLPIHKLKIDRSFVRDVHTDKDSDVIVATIIGMAHSLDLRVTAEGVDSLSQLAVLRRMGCDEHQGYLFSKPVPASEIENRYLVPRELNFGG